MKKIAIVFLCMAAFLFVSAAYAQDASSTGLVIEYPAFTEATSPADFVNKLFQFAIYAAGALAFVMIIYGGIRYIVQAGNTASQGEALDIIKAAVWGIVLLGGSYIILATINPDLVVLSDLSLKNITIRGNLTVLDAPEDQIDTGGGIGGTNLACTTDNTDREELKDLAREILEKKIPLDSNTECKAMGDSPAQIVADLAEGETPVACDSAPTCSICKEGGPSGKATVCPSVLKAIIAVHDKIANRELEDFGGNFTVTSLLGYNGHAKGSTHYKGMGLDISVSPRTKDAWEKIGNAFVNAFGRGGCEYNVDGKRVGPSMAACSGVFASGAVNQHLHFSFGGAGSIDPDKQGDIKNNLAKLATDYLSMNPRLKSDGSYGILPGVKDATYVCSPESNPLRNIQDTAVGEMPMVCNESFAGQRAYNFAEPTDSEPDFQTVFVSKCSCTRGSGVVVREQTLQGLTKLQEERKPGGALEGVDFQVVAITGGIQGTANLGGTVQQAMGWNGLAFEVVPVSGESVSSDAGAWKRLLATAQDIAGGSNAYLKFEQMYRDGDIIVNTVIQRKFDLSDYNDGDSIHDVADDFQDKGGNDCSDDKFYVSNFGGGFPSVLYDEGGYNDSDINNPNFGITDGNIEDEGCYNPRIHITTTGIK